MKRPPSPCRQKHHGKRPDQLFCVTSVDGKQKKTYFGGYFDPAAWEKYCSFISGNQVPDEAVISPAVPSAGLSVEDLCKRFLAANKNILTPARWHLFKQVFLGHLAPFFHLRIDAFGAPQLRMLQKRLDASGKYVKGTVAGYIGLVRRVFRWGRMEGLVSRETVVDLTEAITRSTSRVNPPRESVRPEVYRKTLPFLVPPYREIIQLLYLTGARPSEILNMRTDEIDRSSPTWLYRPAHHKSGYHGKTRLIPLGPQARELITTWFDAHPKRVGYLFQRGDLPRNHFVNIRPIHFIQLSDIVASAAKRAGVPHWTPYQLRHLVATEIQRSSGIEAAGAVLGHASINTTQIYIDRNTAAACQVAEKRG